MPAAASPAVPRDTREERNETSADYQTTRLAAEEETTAAAHAALPPPAESLLQDTPEQGSAPPTRTPPAPSPLSRHTASPDEDLYSDDEAGGAAAGATISGLTEPRKGADPAATDAGVAETQARTATEQYSTEAYPAASASAAVNDAVLGTTEEGACGIAEATELTDAAPDERVRALYDYAGDAESLSFQQVRT